MVHKDLVSYIKKELARGVHIDKIKKVLVKVGHSPHSVEDAIKEVSQKTKSRNPAVIPIVVLVVVIVCLGALAFWLVNTKTEQTESTPAAQTTPAPAEQPAPPAETATQPAAPEEPEQVSVNDIRCLSFANDDVSYCDGEIVMDPGSSDDEYRVRCRADYYYVKAVMADDAAQCANIDDSEQFTKYVCLASINDDSTMCQNILEESDRIECEAVVAQDISKCNTASDDELKNECLSGVARNLAYKNKDTSQCMNILDGSLPEKSQDECIAAITKDTSLCAKTYRLPS